MRQVFLLAIGMFCLGFDAYIVAGLLPDIGATFQVSDSQTGQAVSVFTLCYALAAPIFATLLAGKSVRKILIWALVLFSVANGLSASAANLLWLLLARAVAGIGAGLYSPLAVAAAAGLVHEQKRGRALGLTLGGMSIGTVLGVPIGLFIAKHLGWQCTLLTITILGLLAMVLIVIWFPNIPASLPPSLRERVSMLRNREITKTVCITLLTSIASLGLYTYVASVLQDLAGMHSISAYFWIWGIGGLVGSLSIGTLLDRTGRPDMLMGCILGIMTIAMLSLPFVLKIPLVGYLPFLFWGAAGWASQAPQQHVLLQLQPSHGAAVVALNSSANYLGSSIGSLLGGIVILAGVSPAQLPLAAVCVALLAVLGQWKLILKKNNIDLEKQTNA